jgi:hypothetical protein
VLVSDTSASGAQGVVYRFRLNRHNASPSSYTFDPFGALGSGSPPYGESIALFENLAVIGEPQANRATVWPSDNPNVQVTLTAPAPTGGNVTVTMTKIGTGPSANMTVSTEACGPFTQGLQQALPGTSPTCVRVNNSSPILGLARVCFPPSSTDFRVIRCSSRIACLPGEALKPTTGQCCRSLRPEPTSPSCYLTDGFSSFLGTDSAALLDTDADFWEDLVDNCPLVENLEQFDSDQDGIGDTCDPTPRGPIRVPLGPRWPLPLALVGAVVVALGLRHRYAHGTRRTND